MARMIPAFLSIDAEPDESDPAVGERPWTGFTSMVDFVDGLRDRLAERSGVEPHPTWFFRMDPAIEQCFGRADFVVHRHGATVDHLRARGDHFAIHVHPHRWDSEHGYVYSDHTDPGWGAHCVEASAETFRGAFGEAPKRASMGGRFVSESVVDALVAAGVEVDLSVEPGLAPIGDDRSFGHHATEPSTDFRGHPRQPYRVSRRGLGIEAASADDARPLVEIPRTTYDYVTALAPFRSRLKKRIRGHAGQALPVNMWESWPSPTAYWDLVARAADECPVPFVALTARSDPPSRPSNQTVRAMLAALPDHPLAKRLAFVDPLTFASLRPAPAGQALERTLAECSHGATALDCRGRGR